MLRTTKVVDILADILADFSGSFLWSVFSFWLIFRFAIDAVIKLSISFSVQIILAIDRVYDSRRSEVNTKLIIAQAAQFSK